MDLNGLNLQPDPHPYLSRKDSRRLYTDNDIDITEDIELEPGMKMFYTVHIRGILKIFVCFRAEVQFSSVRRRERYRPDVVQEKASS